MSDQLDTDQAHHDHHGHAPGHRNRALTRFVFLLVFAVVIAAIAFTGESLGHHHAGAAATISVTGSGTVKGSPDTVSFQVGVQTTAKSAAEALDENNAKMKALEAALEKTGVTKKNLQTSNLDVSENTDNAGNVTGFTAEDDLNVTMHQLKKAGAAIDAAAHAVGNGIQLSGITYSISNQSALLAQARARAIESAHTEAAQLAKGGHTTVGAIVRVTDEENTGGGGIVYPYAQLAAKAATSSSVPLEAGTETINVQVEVVYSLAS
jgi:uncharacterized protein